MGLFKKKEKIPEKELGKFVSWEEWENSELPCTANTHMITVLTDKKELRTVIGGGLLDFDLIIKDDDAYLLFHSDMHKESFKNITGYEQFIYSITDDPSCEYAGDWVQMGCMCIRQMMLNPKVEFIDGKMLVSCKVKELIIMPAFNEVFVDKMV